MNKLIDFLIDTMNKVNGMDIRAGDIINYRTTREVRQGTVMMVLRIEDTRIPGEKRGSMLYLDLAGKERTRSQRVRHEACHNRRG